MNAYIDASVVLREVLDQKPRLREWHDLIAGVSSPLLRVECLRTLHRLSVNGAITETNVAEVHQRLAAIFDRIEVLPLDNGVLARASSPLPLPLATLDAIHLATALLYRQTQPRDEPPIFFATFDVALAECARATGFRVLGA